MNKDHTQRKGAKDAKKDNKSIAVRNARLTSDIPPMVAVLQATCIFQTVISALHFFATFAFFAPLR